MTDWLDCFWIVSAVVLAGAAVVALAWVIQRLFAAAPAGGATSWEAEEEPDWLEAILLLELLDDEDFDGDDFEEEDFDSDDLDDNDFDDGFDDDYGYGYG